MVNAYYPQTIEEALKLKSAMKNNAVLIMGGSDLMVRGSKAENMIFLNSISELRQTKCTENELIIGAGCTYCELIENDDVPDILRSIMMDIASPAVRNAGTVVGNICNASPAGDMLPVLYAMDAVIAAASASVCACGNDSSKSHDAETVPYCESVRCPEGTKCNEELRMCETIPKEDVPDNPCDQCTEEQECVDNVCVD